MAHVNLIVSLAAMLPFAFVPTSAPRTAVAAIVLTDQTCNTSSSRFSMPTTSICGKFDCNPGQGVPNANLAQALDLVALSLGPDCEYCPIQDQCEADPTVIPGIGWVIGNEVTADPSCPNGLSYRRCITMPAGERPSSPAAPAIDDQQAAKRNVPCIYGVRGD